MGTRARLTWIASADGIVAPTFVTYTGLNERELLTSICPIGVLVLSIQDLAVEGGTLNNKCTIVGYIVLARKGPGMEQHVFNHYQNSVLRKYISAKINLDDGLPLCEDEHSVQWQDGGLPQLAVILQEESMLVDEKNLITAGKNSASWSAHEQYLDLMSVFKAMKVN